MCMICPDETDQDHYKLNEDTGYCTAELCFVCVKDKDCHQKPPVSKPDSHIIDIDYQPHIGEPVKANCGELMYFCNPIDVKDVKYMEANICSKCFEIHQMTRKEFGLPKKTFVHKGQ